MSDVTAIHNLVQKRNELKKEIAKIIVGQDAVVVRGTAEEHRPGRHQRSFSSFNQFHVTVATGLTSNPVIAGIHEANELRRLAVQQGVGPLRIGRTGEMPGSGIPRQNVSSVSYRAVFG